MKCQSNDFSNIHLADLPNVRRYIFDMENGKHFVKNVIKYYFLSISLI